LRTAATRTAELLTTILISTTILNTVKPSAFATMYVCLCKSITDSHIRTAIADGMTDYRELRMALGLSSQCGRCAVHAREIFREETQGVYDTSLFYAADHPAARAVA